MTPELWKTGAGDLRGGGRAAAREPRRVRLDGDRGGSRARGRGRPPPLGGGESRRLPRVSGRRRGRAARGDGPAGHAPRGPLRPPREDRPGRHGARLPRGALGRGVPPAGRAQDREPRDGHRVHPPALPQRAPDPRGPRPPQHRAPPRRRDDRGRPPVLRDGVHRGQGPPRLVRRAPAAGHGAPQALPRRLRRRRLRAPQPRRPPGPQAGEHLRDGRGRAEAPGLRTREDPQRRRLRPHGGGHRDGGAPPDAGVREPRAGARREDHDVQRHLLARRHPLRAPDGPPSLPAEEPRAGRDRARRLRPGARAAERGRARASRIRRSSTTTGGRPVTPESASARRDSGSGAAPEETPRRPRQHRPRCACARSPRGATRPSSRSRRTSGATSTAGPCAHGAPRSRTARGSSSAATVSPSRPGRSSPWRSS